VGGRRKGFHAVVLERERVIDGPVALGRDGHVGEVTAWLSDLRPVCVAVDSPRSPAPAGESSRPDERGFAGLGICGIRWTPDLDTMRSSASGYYDWILNGLDLYVALDAAAERTGWEVIECFPTATWTIRFRPRSSQRRAAWTREALAALRLAGMPARRLNQDDRDAIAAAYTAALWRSRPREAVRVGRDLVIARDRATTERTGSTNPATA
jgi:hypothetical protein